MTSRRPTSTALLPARSSAGDSPPTPATHLTMKTTNDLLPSRTSLRRPPRPKKNFVRTPPPPEDRLENVLNELDREDTFWTGYVRLLIFVIILGFVGTIAVSL